MISFYTYLHLKPDGSPFYVGKGHGNRSRKFSIRNQHHKNIVAKCGGKENIDVLVFPCDSEQHAFDEEVKWIRVLREAGYVLANQTKGGDGTSGFQHSNETRMKQSIAATGRKHSFETRLKIGQVQIGRTRSAESCEKQASTIRGRKRPQEFCAKMSALNIGRPHTEETRVKLSIANMGKTISAETKRRLSAAAKADWARRKANHSAMTHAPLKE